MSREVNWIMVRLNRDVHARLTRFRDALQEWAANHPDTASPRLTTDEVSLSTAIEALLLRHDTKQARVKKSRRNRATKRHG